MKLALYQGPSCEGDIDLALKVIETNLSAVSVAGAKMLVFPELFLPGYNQSEQHSAVAQTKDGSWHLALSKLCKQYGCGVTIGWAERDGSAIYNSASSFDERGNLIAHYRKIQLFGEMEKSVFDVGNSYTTFRFQGYKVAVLICYDVEFAHHVRALKKLGVNLLLVPTANPIEYKNVSDYIVPGRAAEHGLTIVYTNYCGTENGLRYGGDSLIVGPDGVALATAGKGECILLVDLVVIEEIDKSLLSTQSVDWREFISE